MNETTYSLGMMPEVKFEGHDHRSMLGSLDKKLIKWLVRHRVKAF